MSTLRGALPARILLASVATAAILLVAEAAANLSITRIADDEAFQRYASWAQLQRRQGGVEAKFSPHRYLGHAPTPSWSQGANRHNALGFRGEEIALPKPPGRFRIACLGGSTTYTTAVEDHRLAYPAQLERVLVARGHDQVEVVNAGADGWSSWESVINLATRVIDLEPDLIVVYHGVNDVHPRLVWPPEAYRGDNSGRRVTRAALIFMPSLLEYSALWRVIMVRSGRMAPHAALERTLDVSSSSYVGDLFQRQQRAGTYPSGIFAEVSAARMLEVNRPVYFERNIRNLVALARRIGCAVVLSSFASSPEFAAEPRSSSAEYNAAYDEMSAILERVAAEEGASFLDLRALFPADRALYVDGRHVNAEGAAVKAGLVADHLVASGLLGGVE